MPTDFYPQTEPEKKGWHQNFATKLRVHGPTLGITEPQLVRVEQDAVSVAAELDTTQQLRATYQSQVTKKNRVLHEKETGVRDTVTSIKRHPQYTEEIGRDLGIIGTEPVRRTHESVRPDFSLTTMPNLLRGDWTKLNFDGVLVDCKRGAETQWTRIDKDTRSPFEDRRPNLVAGVPEARTYRLRYFLHDQEIGMWSEEITVIVLM